MSSASAVKQYTRWVVAAQRVISWVDVAVGLLLVFCTGLLVLIAPPLLTGGVHIAQSTVQVVENPLSIWVGPLTTPWFRYVPQSVALWLATVAGIAEGGVYAAVRINGAYALVMEAFVAPLVLYATVSVATDRRVGVVATVLYATALLVTPEVSLEPMLGWTGVCTTCTFQPTGPLWSHSDGWQYAWTMPFVVGTIASTHRAVQSRLGTFGPLVVGVLLAGVISLQFALAAVCLGIVASVVIVRIVHDGQRALYDTVLGVGVTALAILPNLPVVIRTWDVWWAVGQRRVPLLVSVERAISSLPTGTLVAALVGGTMVVVGLVYMAAQAWQPRSSTRRHRALRHQRLEPSERTWLVRHDTFGIWILLAGGGYVFALLGAGEWAQSLLASTALGALCLWSGLVFVEGYERLVSS